MLKKQAMSRISLEKTGMNIRRLMEDKGLTARSMSEQGIVLASAQAIYKWMKGETLPSIDNLYALKAILGVDTIEDLIIFEDDRYEDSDAENHKRIGIAEGKFIAQGDFDADNETISDLMSGVKD